MEMAGIVVGLRRRGVVLWPALCLVGLAATPAVPGADDPSCKQSLWQKATQVHQRIWQEFVCPETFQIYTYLAPKAFRPLLPSYADIAANKPNAAGWGTAIENCALDGGVYLGALVDRYAMTARPEHAREARKIYSGLRLIHSVAERRGCIMRGVMPDRKTHYGESSVDQYTMYVYGLWRFFHSPVATEKEKAEIRMIFKTLLERLEADKFVILTDTGGRTTFGALDRLAPSRAERLLAIVLAGADVTGNPHWHEIYQHLRPPRMRHCRGKGGDPWVLVQNQLAFFLLRRLEKDPAVRKVYVAGSLEAARACVPYLDPPAKSNRLAVINSLAGALTIALTEDREFITQHLDAIRHAVQAYDYRGSRSVNGLRSVECTVWSLARQGLIRSK